MTTDEMARTHKYVNVYKNTTKKRRGNSDSLSWTITAADWDQQIAVISFLKQLKYLFQMERNSSCAR